MTLNPPLGPRNEYNESVSVKVSEEPIPLLKVAEKQHPEISCIKDINYYEEMVNHLPWHYYNEFECNCLKCDPKRWGKNLNEEKVMSVLERTLNKLVLAFSSILWTFLFNKS